MDFSYRTFDLEAYSETESLHDENNEESGFSWKLDIDPLLLMTPGTIYLSVKSEDKPIGYAIFYLHTHPHFQKLVACQDVMYIHPEYRKGSIGIKFIKYIEESMKGLGAEGIFQTSSAKKDLSKLFGRLGYEPVETVYFKEI